MKTLRVIVMLAGIGLTLNPGISGASQGKYGIGISVNEGGALMSFSVNVEKFRIEPIAGFRLIERDDSVDPYGFYSNYEEREVDLGCGIYHVSSLTENLDMLLGLRVMYVDYTEETELYDANGTGTEVFDMDGYELSPAVGFEYQLNKHIGIAGFLRYTYQYLSGEFETDYALDYKRDVGVGTTETELFVKFYF